MNDAFRVPGPPDWSVDWDGLDAAYDWVRAMRGCGQNPRYHAEGDVWVHTRWVCRELAALPAWRALDEARRAEVYAAAVLHDVAKPEVSKPGPDGQISSRGHSTRGEAMARAILWRMGADFAARERIASMIRHHQLPFWLLQRSDPRKTAFEAAERVRFADLLILAEADMRGRICEDQAAMLDDIRLAGEYAAELGCADRPYAFPSDHARVEFFRKEARDPSYRPHFEPQGEVTVMCGLPAAGKTSWVAENLPGIGVVSLDALRERHGVDPADNQGRLVQEAKELARTYLRRGEPFAWDGTHLQQPRRKATIDLCLAYGAKVRVVYVEAPPGVIARRNAARGRTVAERVMERMSRGWSVPDRTEAHEVVFVV